MIRRVAEPAESLQQVLDTARQMSPIVALPRLCGVLLTIAVVLLGMGRGPGDVLGAPQYNHDIVMTEIAGGPPDQRDVEPAQTHGTCPTSGPCWSLPRTAIVSFIMTPAERHSPALSTDALAEWSLPPPDQPPRVSI